MGQMLVKAILVCMSAVSMSGCVSGNADRLSNALSMSGNEKEAITGILERYKSGTLEREAMEYIVSNMPYNLTLDGKGLEKYRNFYHLFAIYGKQALAMVDSIQEASGKFDASTLTPYLDIHYLNPEFIENDLKLAFKTRNRLPWSKSVSDKDFLRYVIPYRIGDERVSEWRSDILHNIPWMNDVIDSLVKKGVDDPLVAAQAIINRWNRKEFQWTSMLPAGPSIGYANVIDKSGTCREFAHGVVYLMRAAGIPSGIDMVPIRGENNSAHSWPFIIGRDGKTYVTCTENPSWVPAAEFDIFAAKIYREEFGINDDINSGLPEEISLRPDFFKVPKFSDVTAIYKPNSLHNLTISGVEYVKTIYLASSSNDQWVPIAISASEDTTCFKNVCGGVVACIGTWDGKSFTPVGYPFEIDAATGKTREIKGGDDTAKVSIYSKFPVDERNGDLVYRIVGGRIEGARHADFRDAVTLFTVTEMPKRRMTVAYPSGSCGAFRYYRYVGPPDGYCNIAEVSLYGNVGDTVPLRGHVFGTPGSWDDDPVHTFEKVFDGNPDTSFDYKEADGGWSAIDLGRPIEVRKIMYVPRNRDNYVRTGDIYELFWYGEGKWNSLGKQQAFSDSLLYDVPKGALLYLRNHSRGKDERIFEYDFEKREQKFW